MKFFKSIGLLCLVLFSFFYVDKVATLGLYKNQLYKKIVNESVNYNVLPVNALIEDEFIIPGLNGKTVNDKRSYQEMKRYNTFNEMFLQFDEIMPDVSLTNNKDKIIKKGNIQKQEVAFIIQDNVQVKNYFLKNNIKANILVNIEEFSSDSFLEQINNDFNNYKKLDNLFKKYNLNNDLCFSLSKKDFCMAQKKYLIEYTYKVDNDILTLKNTVENGNIYYINGDSKLDNVIILMNHIKYKGLQFVYLSELISEQRD